MQIFRLFLSFFLATLFVGCSSTSVVGDISNEMPSPKKIGKVRVALVLGAGGAKGLTHLGVLEVLEEYQIPIDLIVGCSSGSLIGALYADNPNSFAVKEQIINLKQKDLVDTSWFSALQSPWRAKGPVQGYLLQKFLTKSIRANNFNQLKIPLIIAACDLHNGELIKLQSGPIPPAVLASCSIPPFFAPIELYGKTLVDGAVIDPVPVIIAQEFRPDIIIAVDISGSLFPKKPTNLISITKRSAHISYIELSKLRAKEASIIIRPELAGASIFDDSRNWFLYESGKKAALEKIPEIKEKLKSLNRHKLLQYN